jgi:hypothetical protein
MSAVAETPGNGIRMDADIRGPAPPGEIPVGIGRKCRRPRPTPTRQDLVAAVAFLLLTLKKRRSRNQICTSTIHLAGT